MGKGKRTAAGCAPSCAGVGAYTRDSELTIAIPKKICANLETFSSESSGRETNAPAAGGTRCSLGDEWRRSSNFAPKAPEASERDLARKLCQQISKWKVMRAPLRTRTAAGVPVERRSRRRPALERLSA
jgi:hypothetical protein